MEKLILSVKGGIEEKIVYLQDKEYKFWGDKIEIDIENNGGVKSTNVNIVYTLGCTQKFAQNVEQTSLNGDSSRVIMPGSLVKKMKNTLSDLWIINNDHSISKYV